MDLPSDHYDRTRRGAGRLPVNTMPSVDDDLPSGLRPAALGPEEFSARIFGTAGPRTGAYLALAPFRGVRFVPAVAGDPAAVTMPPYDLIDEAAALRLLAGGGHNIVRLNLPRAAGRAMPRRATGCAAGWPRAPSRSTPSHSTSTRRRAAGRSCSAA